ncbi:MAG TPA: peptidylprolyl isomerase [Gemmataceae bacterium]|nr:peptidylprolyl isomerase [Gemmataceae bacterium]
MALEIFFLAGCGKIEPAPPKLNVISQANGSSEPAQIDEKPDLDPRLHQPFSQATVANPPANWQRPPDLTMTNKSVGKLYTEVVRIWDEIKFVSPKGLPLAYRAMLETELGEIEIALRPDLAPNHVRSFVALAKVGYYDGLVFERTIHQTVEGRADAKIEIIEAGCPMGTGDAGYGSIGYWLKPEFHPQAFHEEGTVGASLGEEADTAACKFYINLHKAPYMDGNYTVFGKVTKGLNVARKILSLPVRNDPEYPEGDRPEKRVVIRKVTIQAEEVNK